MNYHPYNVDYRKLSGNDESVDSFYGVLTDVSSSKGSAYKVTLRRAMAQLNIGTKDLSDYNAMSASPLETIGITVDGVYNAMNVMDGSVSGQPATVTIPAASLPAGQTFPVSGCDYLGMSYLLVNERKDVKVTMTAGNGDSTFDTEFADVPLQRNCQTNVYGNLLTKENDFKVEINPEFGDSDDNEQNTRPKEYDLILKVKDKPIRIYYTDESSVQKDIDLSPYMDSENYVKLAWSQIGLSEVKNISFKNQANLLEVDKCDINKLGINSLKEVFYLCRYLEKVPAITSWDTSSITTMENAFSECTALQYVDVSNFDTSNVTDMRQMFAICNGLTSLDVTNFNTSKVTSMASMFGGCYRLTSLDLSNFDTSNVTDMSSMFATCSNLTSLDVSNFDTSNVTNTGGMFRNCYGLTSLDVTNFDTSKVTDMSYMFSNCSGLTSLDLSNLDTSKVTNMSNMFDNCKSLTDLNVSMFSTANVTNMEYMFNYCSTLRSLDISNFNTSKVTNISYMFANLKNILTLDMTGFDMSSLRVKNNVWYGTPNVENIVIGFDISLLSSL